MKVLITGATGLVGRKITELCRQRGYEVHFLSRGKDQLDGIPGAQGFYWDPARGEIDSSCFDGVDVIINLAGAPIATRWTTANKERILNSRVQSLNTLYQGLRQAGSEDIHSLISASAIGIYPHSYTTYYTEKDTEISEKFAGQVVREWEEQARKFESIIPKVAMVRIGLVLSDQGGALPKMAGPVKSFVGASFGSGEQWQSWIHIEDLSNLILFIAENELSGIYNGVAPNPVTQNKLIKEIAKVLNRPLFLPNIPKFVVKLMLGEMSEIVTSSQRVSSKKVESLGFNFEYLNVCLALESLYQKKVGS